MIRVFVGFWEMFMSNFLSENILYTFYVDIFLDISLRHRRKKLMVIIYLSSNNNIKFKFTNCFYINILLWKISVMISIMFRQIQLFLNFLLDYLWCLFFV